MRFLSLPILLITSTGCSIFMTKEPAAPATLRRELLNANLGNEKSVSAVRMNELTMGPMQKAPLHLHPCDTIGVIVEGTITLRIEGQAEQTLRPGQAFFEPANTRIIKFDNDSDQPAKIIVFYLLEKASSETVRILNN